MSYAYAVGRIRVLENRLLSKTDIFNMINAKTLSDALKIISERGYDLSNGVDAALLKAQKEMREVIDSVAPDSTELKLFFYKNDFHNLKLILKSEYLRSEPDQALALPGTVPFDRLLQIMKSEDYKSLSSFQEDAVLKAKELYAKDLDPQKTEVILDKACFAQMLFEAQNTKCAFVIEIVKAMIDIYNITAFFRMILMKKDKKFISFVLKSGGSIKKEFYLENDDLSLESIVPLFSNTPYSEMLSEGFKNMNLSELHRAGEKEIFKIIEKSKYEIITIDPVVSYVFRKEAEIKSIRIIIVGKQNEISPSSLFGKVAEIYV